MAAGTTGLPGQDAGESAGRNCVLAACRFSAPARIPRFESFWDAGEAWRARLGDLNSLTDVLIRVPDESLFPSRARTLDRGVEYVVAVDGWGRTVRTRRGAYFSETLDVALPEGRDPDSVRFEPADDDGRYALWGLTAEATAARIEQEKRRYCVFGKTGGPFLRSCFLRGEEQFLMDIAADPPLARAIADKVADHLTAVGVEQILRWRLQGTGIWIFDDMGQNSGPMFRPESFEQVFLPAYRRMVRAYKEAGARYVFLHSDGNILPVLDMLVDAGIDGLHPLEARAGMDITALRQAYPRLILAGGMDNTDVLLRGPVERIVREAKRIIDLGRDGGVIIGTHSISPETPLEHYVAYHETCLDYGDFASPD